MSFGWMTNTTSSNIMRGPMVMSIVEQILNNTVWGDLDYLVLDLPPGTGDVQLSLCQKLSLSGSVIVTTPQILSVADTGEGNPHVQQAEGAHQRDRGEHVLLQVQARRNLLPLRSARPARLTA